jgi:hypothetical protein
LPNILILMIRVVLIGSALGIAVVALYGSARLRAEQRGVVRQPRPTRIRRQRPTPPETALNRTNHETISDLDLRDSTTHEFVAIAGRLVSESS